MGAGKIPREKATQGVNKPITIPLETPTTIVASSKKALTSGPVINCGKPSNWITNVRAKRTAVRLTHRIID
jgi:hypothetical protein